MSLDLPYPWIEDEALQANFDRIKTQWPATAPTAGTSLPLTAPDGQDYYYTADSTNGVIWHFRYRAAASGSYKWEFVGGAALVDTATASSTRTNTAYGALADADGPSITLPLAGDYDVSFGAQELSSNTNGQPVYMSVGTSTPSDDASAVMVYNYNATSANRDDLTISVARTVRLTGLAAAAAVAAYYRAGTGAQVTAKQRWLNVTPVRVAGS